MEIKEMSVHDLTPYKNNAKKHTDEQIEQIKKSIREYGFNDPIAIWKNNEIIEGHGRLIAALELGVDTVPVIRLDHLTDDKRKAYALIHNKLTMNTPFDKGVLDIELNDIGADLSAFNLNPIQDDPLGYYGKEQERTAKAYNLDIMGGTEITNDFWQMPVIENDNFIPDELIGFKYALTSKDKNVGIHFFIDDYQFERIWRYPERYSDLLFEYQCILSPDFSLYMDMPMPMKIWNVYRNRFIGSYYQQLGLRVIPTLSWAEPETFEFCFKGIEKGSVVATSTLGVYGNKEACKVWAAGMDAAIEAIEPSAILVYGGDIDYDFKDIEVRRYSNKEVFKKLGKGNTDG